MSTTNTLEDGLRDPELMAPTLDLSRPELAEVMARYVHEIPASVDTESPKRSVLLVRNGMTSATETEEAFQHAGFTVETCDGPSCGHCPLLSHESCELRESVDVAVVFIDLDAHNPHASSLLRARCAADASSPGVVAVDGSIETQRSAGRNAVIGARRGPEAIVRTALSLLDAT